MSKVLNQVGESYLVEMAVSTCICIIKATYLGTAPSMAVTEQGSVAAALWLTQALGPGCRTGTVSGVVGSGCDGLRGPTGLLQVLGWVLLAFSPLEKAGYVSAVSWLVLACLARFSSDRPPLEPSWRSPLWDTLGE